MKSLFLAILITASLFSIAQDEPGENNEGFDKLPKGTIRKEIACFSSYGESEKNKSVTRGKTYISGYGKNQYTFKRFAISVTIKSQPFDKSKNKIKRNSDGLIITINGKHVFGQDYDREPPTTSIQSVVVTFGADTLHLPKSAYADLFEPTLLHITDCVDGLCDAPQIYISTDRKRYYIFTTHGDGAGAYEVTWIIQDKKYLRRVVDYGY